MKAKGSWWLWGVLIFMVIVLVWGVYVFIQTLKEASYKPPEVVKNRITRHNLLGIDFPESQNGWVVGNHGVILHTGDGGEHWNAQESGTEVCLADVDFFDKKNGWVAGRYGTIIHTNDGGDSWG